MPGLLGGIARTAVIAGTATAVSNRVSRRQADRWGQQDQAAYTQPQYAQPQYAQPDPTSPPATPAPGTNEMLEQLKQLADLKAQGILTDAEFADQKARILSA